MNQEELKFDTTTGTEVPEPIKSEPRIVPDGQNHAEVLGGLMDEMKNTVEPSVKPLTIEDVDEHNKRVLEERLLKEQEAQQFLRYQNGLVRRRLHVGGSNLTPSKKNKKAKRRAEKKARKK